MIKIQQLNYILLGKNEVFDLILEKEIDQLLELNRLLASKMKAICKPFCDFFGVKQVCFTHMDTNGRAFLINSMPEVLAFYLKGNSFLNDPFIRDASLISEGFAVWSNFGADTYQNETLKIFSERFKLDQGVSIVDCDDSGYYGFSFATSKEHVSTVHKIISSPRYIDQFKMYFERSMQSELKILSQHRINFKRVLGENFFKQPEILPLDNMNDRVKYLLAIGELTPEDLKLKEIRFSGREIQCGLLYGKGYSQPNIAKRMGVKPDQVARYIKKIKDKCNFKGYGHETLPLLRKLYDLGCFGQKDETKRIRKTKLVFNKIPRNLIHNPNEQCRL